MRLEPYGWEGYGEVGLRQQWGALYGTGWMRTDSGGLAVGATW